MKNSITLALITAAILVGCRSVQKSQTSKQSTSEVVEANSTASNKLAVIDSTGAGKRTAEVKKTTDSGYTKITVTKEYFSDEFGLSADSLDTSSTAIPMRIHPGVKPSDNKSGGLLYRETKTYERGQLAKTEEKNLNAEQSVRVKKTDSTAVESASVQQSKQSTTWTTWQEIREKAVSVWPYLVVIALILYVAYRCYKWFSKL